MAKPEAKHQLCHIDDPGIGWMGCGVCNVPVPSNLFHVNHTTGKQHQKKSSKSACAANAEILHTSGTWVKCGLCDSVQPSMEAAKKHIQRKNHKARIRGDRLPVSVASTRSGRSKSRNRGGLRAASRNRSASTSATRQHISLGEQYMTTMSAKLTRVARNQMVRNFHDKCARQPLEEVKKCMPSNEIIRENMLNFMEFDRIECIGSAFEGTNVGPDVEFDTIAVKRCSLRDAPTKLDAKLRRFKESTWTDANGIHSLRSDDTIHKTKCGIQKFINSISEGEQPGLSGQVKVTLIDHRHSAALMIVVESLFNKFRTYSMDITPALELYHSEPDQILIPVHRQPASLQEALEWRVDHVVDEKNLLKRGDENNGCRREAYRVCKAIRDRHQELKKIGSFVLKAALFKLMGQTTAWSRDDLGDRVYNVMTSVRDGVQSGELTRHFDKTRSVVESLKPERRQSIVNYLGNLLREESKMFSYKQYMTTKSVKLTRAARNQMARDFHERCARQPLEEVSNCMKSNQIIRGNMLNFMEFDRIECVGSAFEGTNVGPDVEFDTIVVKLCSLPDAQTKLNAKRRRFKESTWTDGNGSVHSLKSDDTINKTKSGIQKFINSIDRGEQPGLSGQVKVTLIDYKYVALVKIDVESLNNKFEKYSMDITPALELYRSEPDQIQKPVYRQPDSQEEALEWRVDHAVDEKNLLRHGDDNNGCRREVYRVCKAIRDRHQELKKIRSYVLKTALLKVMDQTSAWSRDDLGDRVYDVMTCVRDGVESGELTAHFDKAENVMERLKPRKESILNYLGKLLKEESKMFFFER